MRPFLALLLTAFTGLAGAQAPGQPTSFALVAAFSDRFTFIYETPGHMRTGSHYMDKVRREHADAPPGTFNKIALAELDAAFARKVPASTRVLLSVQGDTPLGLTPEEREALLVERVRGHVRAMPERASWHRIVVALPAWQALDKYGLPGRIEGFGVFMQPTCQSHPRWCGMNFQPPSGADAVTPDGKQVAANFFVAPYSFVAVVILDPATLEVLERQAAYEHQKMFDPLAGVLDLGKNIDKKVLAAKSVEQIGVSLREAMKQTELAGRVEVRDVRDVTKDVKR